MPAVVIAVAASPGHTFGKPTRDRVRLLAGRGVEGDAHSGETAFSARWFVRGPVLVTYCGDDLLGTPDAEGSISLAHKVRRWVTCRCFLGSTRTSPGPFRTEPPSRSIRTRAR